MAAEPKTVRLGDFVDSSLGKMLDKKKNKGTPQPYLGNSNVRWGAFDLEDLSLMKFENEEEERYGIRDGDLIVCEGGEPGRCAIWREQIPGMKIQKALHRVRPKGGLDNYYLYYWFMLAGRTGKLEPFFTGTTIKHLTGTALHELRVPLLPVEEQRAIASILGALDDKIDLNRRMNETLEAMARALFKDWFVDFGPTRAKMEGREPYLAPELWALFPDRLDGEGKPEGWTLDSLGNHMVNFDSKRVPVSGKERAKRKGPYPYHGATGIMDYVDDFLFDGIYLLVGEDGSVVREDGTAFTQYVWGKIWVNNHAHVLQGKGSVSTEQLWMYFVHEQVAPFITGAVQLKLSQGRMNSMPFMYAGKAICQGFSGVTAPWFSRLRANAEESTTLAQTRDLLLPKLMSGEIRVRDAERMVEQLV